MPSFLYNFASCNVRGCLSIMDPPAHVRIYKLVHTPVLVAAKAKSLSDNLMPTATRTVGAPSETCLTPICPTVCSTENYISQLHSAWPPCSASVGCRKTETSDNPSQIGYACFEMAKGSLQSEPLSRPKERPKHTCQNSSLPPALHDELRPE